MCKKPSYEELEHKVKELEKKAIKRTQNEKNLSTDAPPKDRVEMVPAVPHSKLSLYNNNIFCVFIQGHNQPK